MTGSRIRIWKQDPTVAAIGLRPTYIHTDVRDGPRDDDIAIEGMPFARADGRGDFIFDPQENPKEFDACHTFAVVRQVLTIYRRALRRNQVMDNLGWQWGDGGPIEVFPRAGEDRNAFYQRSSRSLRFFYFHPGDDPNRPLVYTCRSFDIVSHEVGHAILDALRPGYWNSWHHQTGALHESFGDLTTIFTMLAQMDQCEAIIAESKADLHAKTFFPAVAEQFGQALYGRAGGLRNADNDLKLSEVSNEVHDLSQVFTGAIYDILADIFDDYQKPDEYDQAETLFRVGKHMTALVIWSLVTGPETNATFRDIAERMIDLEPVAAWKEFIHQRFEEREVLGPSVALAKVEPQDVEWRRCCGTLQHHEHVEGVADAVKKARQ